MKKSILYLILLFFPLCISAQTPITVGMTGVQLRTALNSNEGRNNLRFDTTHIRIDSLNLFLKGAESNISVGKFAGRKFENNLTFPKGAYNVALGAYAAQNLTHGYSNVAIGYGSFQNDTAGYDNIAIGYNAMQSANKNNSNIAIGTNALHTIYPAINSNIAIGTESQYYAHGNCNISIGMLSLSKNQAWDNVAIGSSAMTNTVNGEKNVGVGTDVLISNINGLANTGIGEAALYNSIGSANIALGYNAGWWETGNYNLYIDSKLSANYKDAKNNALIYGKIGADSTTQMVKVSGYLMATGTTSSTGTAVVMNNYGRFYMLSSSREYKHNIRGFAGNWDAILKVRPVKYEYKGTEATDIGYIAEEFQTLGLTNLLNYKDGKPFSIKYDKIPLYLIEVIKKQQKQIDDLDTRIKVLENK